MNTPIEIRPTPSLPLKKGEFSFHPWVLFGIFLSSNTLLSYFPWPNPVKLWVGVFGLLIPFLLACWDLTQKRNGSVPTPLSPFRDEFLPEGWFKWGGWFLTLAMVLRFWQLTTLSVWPLDDDGLVGSISQGMVEGEPLRLFHAYNSIPPFTFMGLAFFFRILGISLFSLWLYPAVLSTLALFVWRWAARRLFSSSYAFLFQLGVGLCFWPLFIGRFVNWGGPLFLGEGVSFLLFSFYLSGNPGKPRSFATILLGLSVGLGFYTYHTWGVVAAVLGLAVTLDCLHAKRKDWASFFTFLLAAGAGALPIAWKLLQNLDPTFLNAVWAFQGHVGLSSFMALVSNILAYFWGPIPFDIFSYNPLWGGFFNPVTSSLIFLGLLELARERAQGWVLFFLLSGFILWLPQGLSRGQEYMRGIQLIPVFVFLLVLGARYLILHPPGRTIRLGTWVLALLSLSLGCDGYHLFGAYHQRWSVIHDTGFQNKSLERQRAFEFFDRTRAQWGPGLILGDLTDDIHDQTLELAAWEFNALENPKAPSPRVPWAGLLCNVHYRGYLAKLLPQAQWKDLATDVFRENGGLMAGVIPVNSTNLPVLARWAKAQKTMHGFAQEILETQHSPHTERLPGRMAPAYPLFQGDPFLESCFWEKQAQNYFMNRKYAEMIKPLENALQLGVPEAHLYNRLGVACLATGDFKKAQWALEHALACPDNRTSAAYLYTHYLLPRQILIVP